MRPVCIAVIALLCLTIPAIAGLRLPALISDHAVFQADKPIVIYGWADAGEEIAVQLDAPTRVTRAGEDGSWRVALDPMPADDRPRTLVVTSAHKTLTVRDVLIGEVWLCSGQSNMQFPVRRTPDAELRLRDADRPAIRVFVVPQDADWTPRADVTGRWVVATPDAAAGWSAVAFYFALQIHDRVGAPVGILASHWTGTPISAWTPRDALLATPRLEEVHAEIVQLQRDHPDITARFPDYHAAWRKNYNAFVHDNVAWQQLTPQEREGRTAPQLSDPLGHRNTPGALYCAMIAPLTNSAIRGVLWYQGENDAKRRDDAFAYRDAFPAMIDAWRTAWGEPLPFLFVQLPNWKGTPANAWTVLRDSQAHTAAHTPGVGMAVTIDVGERDDVHPPNKWPVAERLGRLALARVYNHDVIDSGPVLASVCMKEARARIGFDHTHGGLTVRPGALTGFEIAAADGLFVPAEAQIDCDTVLVWSDRVSDPVAVRYAWSDDPPVTLFNGEGLPAAPFHTDPNRSEE